MNRKRSRMKGLAMAIVSLTTITSDAAMTITSAFDGTDTAITFTITEGVYRSGVETFNTITSWGSATGGTTVSSTTKVSDTISYTTAKTNTIQIQYNASAVNYFYLHTLAAGTQSLQDGAVTFLFGGDLSHLNFDNLALDATFGASFSGINDAASSTNVPEPSSVGLTLLGASCLFLRRKR